MRYTPLPTRCNASVTGLREAALLLKPSRVYILRVGVRAYYDGKDAAALAMEKENPFSPYINLIVDSELGREEWYLQDEHGNAVGSEGV